MNEDEEYEAGIVKPRTAGNRILGGAYIFEENNFKFCVWAYRKLTDFEMKFTYAEFQRQRDKRRTLRNKQVDVISNHGI